MSLYVLDTSILLGYIRGSLYVEYLEKHHNISDPSNFALISIVTVGEIYSLANQLNWGAEKRKRLDGLLRKLPTIDISRELILKAYAEIDAYSLSKHQSKPLPHSAKIMGKNDLWIAATASVLKATLITTDHDFDHLNKVYLDVLYVDPSFKP